MGMRTLRQIAKQWELLGIAICTFCEFPLHDEAENHRCLADPNGCGCGSECSLKEDKCGCKQCGEVI